MSVLRNDAPTVVNGRYSLIRTLRAREGVETCLSCDLETGASVVLTLAERTQVSHSQLERVRDEAELLRSSQCPQLAPVLDWGTDAGWAFTVSPCIPGESLAVRLQGGPLALSESLLIAQAVLCGLRTVQDGGLCHLNVRPAKVMVPADPHVDQAVLLPAGLSRTPRLENLRHEAPSNQVRYASPEQLGIIDRPVDARSDLYSTGALLYTCLAGAPPYDAATIVDFVGKAAAGSFKPIQGRTSTLPRSVNDFLRRLLSRDPDDRYQTAEAALADAEGLGEASASEPLSRALALGRRDRRSSLTLPSLIGRESDVHRLEHHLDDVVQGRGGLVLIEGESGCGKSRLLQELRTLALDKGLFVFEGSRMEPRMLRPLAALDGIAEAVVRRAQRDEWFAERLRADLEPVREVVALSLPDLSSVLRGTSNGCQPHSRQGRNQTVRGLVDLLEALGAPSAPAVILLDDFQWADDLSIDSVVEWQRAHDADTHVLIVATCRSRDIDGRHPLPQVALHDRMRLRPLDPQEVRALVESSAGLLPDAVLDTIEEWAEGNPFMATAALRGLIEAGAVRPGEAGWTLDNAKLDAARVGSNAASMLSRRLSRLSPEATHVLSLAAVLGTRFELSVVARLAKRSGTAVWRGAQEARAANIIFSCGDATAHAFVHIRLREAVLANLTAEQRRAIHAMAAIDLQANDPTNAFDLAHHFDAAGDSPRAVHYALPAAREATARFAFDVAEELYRVAAAAAADVTVEVRRDIDAELGQVLKYRGRYEEATACLQRVRALADTVQQVAWTEAELGELAFKQGDSHRARVHLEAAIGHCGGQLPRRRAGSVLLLMRELVVRLVQIVLGPRLRKRRASSPDQNLMRLSHLYHRLLYSMWFEQRTALATMWCDLRQLNLAERAGDPRTLARALAVHGGFVTGLAPGMWRSGLRRVDRGMRIQRELDDAWGYAQSLKYRGTAHFAAGHSQEALDDLYGASRALEQMGDLWESNLGRWHAALAHYRLGDIGQTVAVCRQTWAIATQIGDRQAGAASLATWAKAAEGDLPDDARAALSTRATDDVYTQAMILQAKAVTLLADGNAPSAAAVLRQARKLLRRSPLFSELTASTLAWLATADRRAAMDTPLMSARARRRLLRRAARTARVAVLVGGLFRHNLPHARREAGLVCALRGQERRAKRQLRRSLLLASKTSAAQEEEKTRRALAVLASGTGQPVKDEDGSLVGKFALAAQSLDPRTSARAAAPVGHLAGVALLQRYEALLECGRKITAAGSHRDLLVALRESAVVLLRAESCSIVRVPGPGETRRQVAGLPFESPSDEDQVSIELALRLGHPVATGCTSDEADGFSGNDDYERSVLYAPIVCQEGPVACLRAVHSSVKRMFDDQEENLSGFLVSLGAAAFDRIALQEKMLEQVIGAQDGERARIARDLHDELGQGLTSLLLEFSQAEMRGRVTSLDSGFSGELRQGIHHLLNQVRRLAFDLHPIILDDLGLGAALSRLVEDVATRNDITVDLEAEVLAGIGRLPSRLETTIYRVTQEALTNVARHAAAQVCSVFIIREGRWLKLMVEDDGRGFEVNSTNLGSLGLRGMRERAGLVGGTLSVTSGAKSGTTVVLEIPLD